MAPIGCFAPRISVIGAEYISSQCLCEFIKKSGFDGVGYRSSVSEGINLALFAPAKATGAGVTLYNVSKFSAEVAAA